MNWHGNCLYPAYDARGCKPPHARPPVVIQPGALAGLFFARQRLYTRKYRKCTGVSPPLRRSAYACRRPSSRPPANRGIATCSASAERRGSACGELSLLHVCLSRPFTVERLRSVERLSQAVHRVSNASSISSPVSSTGPSSQPVTAAPPKTNKKDSNNNLTSRRMLFFTSNSPCIGAFH